LEDQVAALQKTNLNVYVPLSENHGCEGGDYRGLIAKLRLQIVGLEQDNAVQRMLVKKVEKEKEEIRVKLNK
jgi:hypothetical protein